MFSESSWISRSSGETFPMWRNSGECAPVDGDQEMTLADEAAGATSVDVAADADPASDQDPEADGGLKDGLAPTDPVAPPMSVGRLQPIDPTEAERIAHNRTHIPFADWCESCVRGRGCDDPQRTRQDQDEGNPLPVVQCDYFFLKAEKKDILCKAISAIDSVYNRTMALECEFKGLSDHALHGLSGWTMDPKTFTSQGQTYARTCGKIPCDSWRVDAHVAKRCDEEVRSILASAPPDGGMARQTLCLVAWSVRDEAARPTISKLSLLKEFCGNNYAHVIWTAEEDNLPTNTRQLLEDCGLVGCHSTRGNDLSNYTKIDSTGYVRLLWESNGGANEFSHAAIIEVIFGKTSERALEDLRKQNSWYAFLWSWNCRISHWRQQPE